MFYIKHCFNPSSISFLIKYCFVVMINKDKIYAYTCICRSKCNRRYIYNTIFVFYFLQLNNKYENDTWCGIDMYKVHMHW